MKIQIDRTPNLTIPLMGIEPYGWFRRMGDNMPRQVCPCGTPTTLATLAAKTHELMFVDRHEQVVPLKLLLMRFEESDNEATTETNEAFFSEFAPDEPMQSSLMDDDDKDDDDAA